MPRVWFHVLCRDEGDKAACERTKAIMHDCKAYDSGPTAAYHHVGERRFGSVTRPCVAWTSSTSRQAGTSPSYLPG